MGGVAGLLLPSDIALAANPFSWGVNAVLLAS